MLFLAPYLLAALAIIPLIWWVLHIRPPKPLLQPFPAVDWLRHLVSSQQTPHSPKLWRLLLRIAAVSLIIIGFSQPFLTQSPIQKNAEHHTPLVLVIDNGWASIAQWSKLKTLLTHMATQAQLANRKLSLLCTAPTEGGTFSILLSTNKAGELFPFLKNLHPQPWPEDRRGAARHLEHMHILSPDADILYFSDKLKGEGDDTFYEALHRFQHVEEHQFEATKNEGKYTLLLHPSPTLDKIDLSAWPLSFSRVFSIKFEKAHNHTVGFYTATLPAYATSIQIPVQLPATIRAQIERVRIEGQETPGSTLYLNAGAHYRPVGLVGGNQSLTPLIGAHYYTHHALEKFADLHIGTIDELLSQHLSVIIAPDGSLNSASDRQKIAEWVKNGGTLVRFAGHLLTQNEHHDRLNTPHISPENKFTTSDIATRLLPVPLLEGVRQFGSGMSWGKPQKLARFPAQSPFAGLPIPADITVTRQVLAVPTTDLSQHVWAQLEDGTPLITHASLGAGHIILFHIPPTPSWSNLPISGLFVSLMERIIDTAQGITPPDENSLLPPLSMIGENGELITPSLSAQPLSSLAFESTPVTYLHPAGIYGSATQQKNLNIGATLKTLSPQRIMAPSAQLNMQHAPTPLAPSLFLLGFILLLIDLGLTFLPFPCWLSKPITGIIFASIMMGTSAHAATTSPDVPQAALETRLAYIRTGNPDIDKVSEQGLEGLSAYVNARTSAVIGHPDGVNPEKDDMAYYPLIYWPITPDVQSNKKRAVALNNFMAHGGILLIDTQGTDASALQKDNEETDFVKFVPHISEALKRATDGVNIPSLAPLSTGHVLGHTFYLLRSFPGRYNGAPLWIAQDESNQIDGVSPLIIGANDWAHAWAVDAQGHTLYAVLPGGEPQRQLAYRVGVNMVIYALTGNYKADQAHVPELLKRLQNEH